MKTVSQRLRFRKALTVDGDRVIKMLVEKYHIQHMDAIQLVMDGGPMLSVALVGLVEGRK